jgi:hypothetical protein
MLLRRTGLRTVSIREQEYASEERGFPRADFASSAPVRASLIIMDENGTDIFRPYSRPKPFRGVLIHPYPNPDI